VCGYLLELLQARWPQAFATQPAAVRPLATGVHGAVIAQLPEYTPRLIRYVLGSCPKIPGKGWE